MLNTVELDLKPATLANLCSGVRSSNEHGSKYLHQECVNCNRRVDSMEAKVYMPSSGNAYFKCEQKLC